MKEYNRFILFLFTLISIFLISSCSSIARYSPIAYENATSLKVEALELMDKAIEPYDQHALEIEELITKVEKAYEYAKGLPKNEISTRQWAILKNPERNLLGGFIEKWKKDKTLAKVFIKEAKGLVEDAFDTIIGLESGKIKPKDLSDA